MLSSQARSSILRGQTADHQCANSSVSENDVKYSSSSWTQRSDSIKQDKEKPWYYNHQICLHGKINIKQMLCNYIRWWCVLMTFSYSDYNIFFSFENNNFKFPKHWSKFHQGSNLTEYHQHDTWNTKLHGKKTMQILHQTSTYLNLAKLPKISLPHPTIFYVWLSHFETLPRTGFKRWSIMCWLYKKSGTCWRNGCIKRN